MQNSQTPLPVPVLDERRLLTEIEVEQIYGLNRRTLQADRLRGDGIQFVKIGRAVRYRVADIDAFIEKSIRRSTSDQGYTLTATHR